jgi:hypothetical protein
MKRLMIAMLGLAFAITVVTPSFAQGQEEKKVEKKKVKKSKKKKGAEEEKK